MYGVLLGARCGIFQQHKRNECESVIESMRDK
jgi:hypothetical protein